jgi:hypothetical protein
VLSTHPESNNYILRRKTMSEETRKIEQSEKTEQAGPEANTNEISAEDLNNVAGGGTVHMGWDVTKGSAA